MLSPATTHQAVRASTLRRPVSRYGAREAPATEGSATGSGMGRRDCVMGACVGGGGRGINTLPLPRPPVKTSLFLPPPPPRSPPMTGAPLPHALDRLPAWAERYRASARLVLLLDFDG